MEWVPAGIFGGLRQRECFDAIAQVILDIEIALANGTELTGLAFLVAKGRLVVKVLAVVGGFLVAAVVDVLDVNVGGAIVVGLDFLVGCPATPSNL